MPAPSQRSVRIKLIGYAFSALGLATWLVYMVLKYAYNRAMPILVFVALGAFLLGFALRRSVDQSS